MFTENRPTRVLVVDDDPHLLEFMASCLRDANCQVRTALDGEQALRESQAFRPDIVFLDVVIPDQDGWLVCSKLKLRTPAPVVVIMTGFTEDNVDGFARFVHADEVLRKPFSEHDVLRVLDALAVA